MITAPPPIPVPVVIARTVLIDKALVEKMHRTSGVNWHEVAAAAFREQLKELEATGGGR